MPRPSPSSRDTPKPKPKPKSKQATSKTHTPPKSKPKSGKKPRRKAGRVRASNQSKDEMDEKALPAPGFFIDTGSASARGHSSTAGATSATGDDVEYKPTSFTPLPRSLLSGASMDLSPEPSSPKPSTSTVPPVGDIIIDEVPLQTTSTSAKDDVTTTSNEHFDPPGLFSTTMMPTLTQQGGETVVELQKDQNEKKTKKDESKEESNQDGGLLLPSHILIDSSLAPTGADTDQEGGGVGHEDDDPMEGLHFVDDDISRGSKRYFDPEETAGNEVEPTFLATADQSKICQNCKRPGHRSKDCTHIICMTCGAEDSHERRDCPVGLVCYGCGGRGHRKQDCPDLDSRNSRRTGCDRCGSRDHMENTCPTLWRVYLYRSRADREEVQKIKAGADGWEKEAVGGEPTEEWCYNCAREGHFGDDCSQRRGSLAYLTVPSAFSYEMSTRGPFAASSSSASSSRKKNLPAPTHARWLDEDDDVRDKDLPFITGGYKNFAGANAGKKSREKERQRQYAKEREKDSEDDDPSWFDGPASSRGGAGRGRGLNIRGRGGRGGMSTPTGPRNGAGRRPWDSEYREPPPRQSHGRNRSRSPPARRRNDRREDGMPFSHGHLMTPGGPGGGQSGRSTPASAPAKVISFGKLSTPGSGGVTDSPSIRGGGGGAIGAGSKALLQRALGGGNGGGGGGTPKSNRGGSSSGGGSNSPSPLTRTPEPSTPTAGSGKRDDSGRKNRKRNKEQEKEKDWESEWRRGGNGGGNVSKWGQEMDKESPKEGKTPSKDRGGLSIKGRSGGGAATPGSQSKGGNGKKGGGGGGTTGQRYHGSYM
ncbi:hypothetical protein CI109_101809 [Kwoniella shandongensis]|uniref:Uncharacterized protein n=1 Tax=Kwoniella shandongensis TaxID=1734106 RepID=A0A5M6CB05_9TREE|nr:uncharacterized protein CI109_001069 [Kwoniella shandongensis]KAA5530269.1 hypothetical protein CI109_001069 [Kwoniella shandongensis]